MTGVARSEDGHLLRIQSNTIRQRHDPIPNVACEISAIGDAYAAGVSLFESLGACVFADGVVWCWSFEVLW